MGRETIRPTADWSAALRVQKTAECLRQDVPHVSSSHTNDDVLAMFAAESRLIALPVVENGVPVGLINRNQFMDAMARPFHREIYGRKSCTHFMDPEPLIVGRSVSIPELGFLLADAAKPLADGFIVTADGHYHGMGSSRDLIRAIANLQAEKNRLVTESISYASVIQKSFLHPSRAALAGTLQDFFFLWEPRDIVGGDYFFFARFDDGFFFAVVDCTGHGVPGAFLTLIVASFLERALEYEKRRDPAAVLVDVNRMIKHALGQSNACVPGNETQSDDGMDAVFAWVEAQGPMTYASARMTVFKLGRHDPQPVDLPTDRVGAGYADTPPDYRWTNRTVTLRSGDAVYVSTDGIIDQIGGERKIAFGKKRLKETLLTHRERPLQEQGTAVLAALQRYQGEESRRDDISVFGFRV